MNEGFRGAPAANMVPTAKKRLVRRAKLQGPPDIPKATHEGEMHIGHATIPCYVLEDSRRVITQRGLQSALGMNSSGGARRLLNFVGYFAVKGIDTKDLESRVAEPIKFYTSESVKAGTIAHGYEASALADMCDMILDARKAGLLRKAQLHYADYCEVLLRSFARLGIIALVDEVTCYQHERPRQDLEDQLKKFISESLRRWVRTFPYEYIQQLCRLRGVELRPDMRLPQYFGILTNNIVYHRLAPGILKRLKDRKLNLGSPSNKLHSWLSSDVGIPELHLHLGAVVMLMKLHTDYNKFIEQLDKIAPVYPEVPGLFDDPDDWK